MQNEHDFWHATLTAYESKPDLATTMAQNFAALIDMIGKGKNGIREAKELLNDGIDEIYRYTDFNQASVKLYNRYVSNGGLKPENDPLFIAEQLEKSQPTAKARRSANKK